MARTDPDPSAAREKTADAGARRPAAPEPPKKYLPYLDEGNPKFKTYPRPAPVAFGRDALLLVWLVVGWYVVTVVGNVYGLVHAGFAGVTAESLRAALELPGPLADPHTPLWVEGVFGLGVLALTAICFGATRDAVREHEVEEWRQKQEIFRRLPTEGRREEPALPFDDLDAPDAAHFVGRAADLDWVLARLRPNPGAPPPELGPLAAITGMGGVGKTALAGVALRRLYMDGAYPDGIVALRCEDKTDPAGILRLILARFGQPGDELDRETLDQLGDRARRVFRGKRVLVALDNVEPDWPLGDVVSRLRAAGLAVLLTARQTLPHAVVPLEASHVLELLSPDEALRLFAQSYGRPDTLDLTRGERAAAERIAKALGYHTLAIKLAAAYAADQKLELNDLAADLQARPNRGLELPEDDAPDGVKRALARSVDALPDGACRLFAALAAFATAEFGRGAALALAAGLQLPSGEADLNLLVRRALLDASLNDRMPEDSDRQRLRLHPLLRAYAARDLATWPSSARDAADTAIAVHYAGYVNATADAALVPDEENITSALERAHEREADKEVRDICRGMMTYWRDRSKTADRQHYLPWGLAAAERIAATTGEAGDRRWLANLQYGMGDLSLYLGQLATAEAYLTQSLATYQELGDQQGEGVALSLLGDLALRRGDVAGAQTAYERYLAIMREVGDQREEGVALYKLALLFERLDDLDRAEAYHRQSLQLSLDVQAVQDIADSYAYLGEFLITKRDGRDEGCGMLSEAARLYASMNLPARADAVRETASRLGCG